MQLPALVETPALPSARALAEAVLAQPTPDPAQVETLAAFLGAPAIELSASAISLRIAVGAANEGRVFVHHEHRLSPVMPAEAQPEIDVGLGADALPEDWHDGVLVVPKYFSAFLEAPLPTFNPGYRSKWRPHELLHRLARFAWRPDLTRFEAYLSARLSELLPVVHWYGFDQIGRYTSPQRRGLRPDRTYSEACEAGLAPFGTFDVALADAESAAAHGLEHLNAELEACAQELETGRIVSTPRPGLDASSDAVGYLRAHWNRITAWSFGAWVERFTTVGEDRFRTCADQLAHVQTLAHRLWGSAWSLESEGVRDDARARRAAADLGYRVLLHVEALDSDEAEDTLMPAVDALAAADAKTLPAALDDLASRLRAVDPAAADRTLAAGWWWRPPEPGARTSVAAGLRSALPRSLAALEDVALASQVDGFLDADRPPVVSSLGERFAAHGEATGATAADVATFEAWLRSGPTGDLEAERFGALPDGPDAPGRVRLNTTLRRSTASVAALTTVLGDETATEATPLVAIRWAGEPRVVDETEEVRVALEAAAQGHLHPGETTDTLLERGFLAWFPDVR
ncbi:MAG: hypothetical protein AAGA54_05145 [Myxococcota bacterium]